MTEDAGETGPKDSTDAQRYCASCGALFTGDDTYCPSCGVRWEPHTFDSVASIVTMLDELRGLRDDGLIDARGYEAARSLYERRLERVRTTPATASPRPQQAVTPAAAAPPRLPWRTDGAPAPPPRSRQSVGEWAAARQADIILYLGAFLLSVAALIFVGFSGEAFGGVARCLVLLLYTVAFLALGVWLPRWERVREAGPVFLALGALLTPINAIALRTQVLDGGDLPDDVLLLLGAAITGGLYLLLAVRGYGRLYAVAGALALVVAWAALGSVLGLYPDWFAVWFAVAVLTLVVGAARLPARWFVERVAYAIGVFAVVAAHSLALNEDVVRWQLPVTYLLTLAAAAILARRRWVPALSVLPALAALLGLTTWWATTGLESGWWSVGIAGAGLGYLALAEWDARHRDQWHRAAAGAAALALVVAYDFDFAAVPTSWQVPATWLMVAAGSAWEMWRGRVAGTLLLPAAAGFALHGIVLALGAPAVWSTYPLFGIAIAIVAAKPWWSARPQFARFGWPYILVVAIAVPAVATALYVASPAHGVAGFTIAAALFAVAALRTGGALVRLIPGEQTERLGALERQGLARAASALLFVAAAYLNAALGLVGAERAWVYGAIGGAAWLGVIIARRRGGMISILVPTAISALVLAALLARDQPASAALILTLGVLGSVVAFATSRRPAFWLSAAAFAAAALAFGWRALDLAGAFYPLACAGAAAVLSLVLTPRRDYARDEHGQTVTLLTWGPWLLALTAASVLLLRAGEAGAAESLTQTREWVVLTITLLAAAVAVMLEGRRLRSGEVAVAGSGGVLLALLLGIAVTEPSNVQAYTLPAGLYAIALGFLWRGAPALIEQHLDANEGLMLAGMALIVLPAAEQAFEPGGGRFGLELIGIGLIFLTVGVVLSARWFVVGAVLTLAGVALRWLLAESAIPYWLTLGAAGMLLLGAGTLLLFERERWDAFKSRVRLWWMERPSLWPLP